MILYIYAYILATPLPITKEWSQRNIEILNVWSQNRIPDTSWWRRGEWSVYASMHKVMMAGLQLMHSFILKSHSNKKLHFGHVPIFCYCTVCFKLHLVQKILEPYQFYGVVSTLIGWPFAEILQRSAWFCKLSHFRLDTLCLTFHMSTFQNEITRNSGVKECSNVSTLE